jgi:PAS domain S-box-containing protein/diguanylate cyclase (GGDEF)-like protein
MTDVWPAGNAPMDDPLQNRLHELRWPEGSPEQASSAWEEFEQSYLYDESEPDAAVRETTDGGRTELPPTADRGLMARTFAYLYGLGATLVLVSVAVPHPPYRSLAGMVTPALIAYGVVALMLFGGERLPLWLFRLLPILGTVLISSVVLSSDSEMVGVFLFFYFWPALAVFYFFGRRWAATNLAVVGAAAAVVLAIEPHASNVPLKWLILMWLLAAAAVLVGLLREHVERLVGRLAHGVEEITASARELSHSHALTRSIIETAHEAFISIDATGAIREWNAEAERIFGWTREEVLGSSVVHTIIPPEERAARERALAHSIGPGEGSLVDRRIELTAIRRDGTEFPVEGTISALAWGDGHLLNAFLHDITERKRVEREAAEYTTSIEAIEEATRQIARGVDPRAVRSAICDGARKAADAIAVMLFEPSPDGRGLVATASAGSAHQRMSLPFTGPRSAATAAFTSGEPVLVPNLPTDRGVERELATSLGVVSGLWQPIHRAGSTIAVLAMLWPEPVDDFPKRLVPVIGLLADRAAVAIARSEVLLRLEEIARTDVPTGLPNHRAWDEGLKRELARARREERSLTVALIDIDHFNDYLDTHLPPSADRLIKELTSAWSHQLRPTDVLARYSEGQFALALLDCSPEDTSRLLKRLRDATPGGRFCTVGVARWNGEEASDQLMTRAWAELRKREHTNRRGSVASADGGGSNG